MFKNRNNQIIRIIFIFCTILLLSSTTFVDCKFIDHNLSHSSLVNLKCLHPSTMCTEQIIKDRINNCKSLDQPTNIIGKCIKDAVIQNRSCKDSCTKEHL
ncbi:hypothetical protein DFA_01458 [Cavenderia fasciculata]|uniref:Uncharacterized protein n=1 Tax=Cavenderia fasciculata TaxID=261658 RepID=F4PSU4_CACFS|nr:uncharacterized protein DFA_01458 [Cavenderia fasciculata]EGG21572.1 hypothetical protein DFA_01458 [Cavenderia fasciculata]|eukprot:XP_004359422.1 hypothetical protein DFA_01458 [Cavenderia fasciculata]